MAAPERSHAWKVAIVLLHCNIKLLRRFAVRCVCRAGRLQSAGGHVRRPEAMHRACRNRSFHAPDHDHDRCTADALAHAEALCAQRAQRLTPIRRQVLEVLLESHKPLGAYEIMDRAGRRRRAAGADHDLSRARFPARQRPRASHREPQRLHRLRQQSRDRRSRGVPDLRALRRGRRGGRPPAVAEQLKTAARAAGFTPKAPVIEIAGVCAHCRQHEHA